MMHHPRARRNDPFSSLLSINGHPLKSGYSLLMDFIPAVPYRARQGWRHIPSRKGHPFEPFLVKLFFRLYILAVYSDERTKSSKIRPDEASDFRRAGSDSGTPTRDSALVGRADSALRAGNDAANHTQK
jgi:hypothetical protein